MSCDQLECEESHSICKTHPFTREDAAGRRQQGVRQEVSEMKKIKMQHNELLCIMKQDAALTVSSIR